MKPDPICITKQNFRFASEGERDFEKKRIDEIPYTNLCWVFFLCLMLLSLAVPFFFCFSLFLCSVCVLALFLCIYLPFSVCALQFIEELRSSFPLFLLLTDQFMGLFESVFLPQFLTSWLAMPHYLHFSDSWQVTPFLLRCGVL